MDWLQARVIISAQLDSHDACPTNRFSPMITPRVGTRRETILSITQGWAFSFQITLQGQPASFGPCTLAATCHPNSKLSETAWLLPMASRSNWDLWSRNGQRPCCGLWGRSLNPSLPGLDYNKSAQIGRMAWTCVLHDSSEGRAWSRTAPQARAGRIAAKHHERVMACNS